MVVSSTDLPGYICTLENNPSHFHSELKDTQRRYLNMSHSCQNLVVIIDYHK